MIFAIFGAIGAGDAKMVMAIGAWLGIYIVISTLFLACLFGIVWYACRYAKQIMSSSQTKKPQGIPFGCCLFAGLLTLLGLGVVFWMT